jgi:uncharacterized protein YbjT (DUF2867 family)
VIVVTGATGQVGGLVARQLVRLGVPFRMAVTDADRAPDVPAEAVVAPYEDADALARALEPGDRVFMVSMFAPPHQRLALHRSFVAAAVARRVARVVYLSFVGAGEAASFRHARSHGATEALLAESGIPFTAVRNAMYADEIPAWFDAEGRITGPGGEGRASFSYRPELAQAIALLLADDAFDERSVVTVTGSESVTLAELAEIASDVTGRDYRYAPAERGAWIAYRRSLLRPEWSIEAGLSYYDGVSAGEADVVGDDYRLLTGKEPLTIAEIIARHRFEMPLAGGPPA